jgi:hypothetical protein
MMETQTRKMTDPGDAKAAVRQRIAQYDGHKPQCRRALGTRRHWVALGLLVFDPGWFRRRHS